MLAIRQALVPPDDEHRFGHGKAEPLAGLAQAAFIAGSAVLLFFEAARRLADPPPVSNTGVGIAVMVVSILASLGLVALQRHVIRRTGSVAVGADSCITRATCCSTARSSCRCSPAAGSRRPGSIRCSPSASASSSCGARCRSSACR